MKRIREEEEWVKSRSWRLVTVEIVKVEIESVRLEIITDFACPDFDR